MAEEPLWHALSDLREDIIRAIDLRLTQQGIADIPNIQTARRDIVESIYLRMAVWLQERRLGGRIAAGDWRCYECGQRVPKVYIVADEKVVPPKVCCLECYTMPPLGQEE
jgi:hypothetical protein